MGSRSSMEVQSSACVLREKDYLFLQQLGRGYVFRLQRASWCLDFVFRDFSPNFCGQHIETKKLVHLKEVENETDDEDSHLFVEAWARFRHPNICACDGYFRTGSGNSVVRLAVTSMHDLAQLVVFPLAYG